MIDSKNLIEIIIVKRYLRDIGEIDGKQREIKNGPVLSRRYEDERLPFSLELNPDGNEIANGAGVRHRLQPNAAEMGSERSISIHPSSPSKSTSVPAAAVATVCHTRSPTHPPESTHNYETTFDLDGNVETASLTSSRDGNR